MNRKLKIFTRNYLITLEILLLATLLISDWTNILNYSGSLFCSAGMKNWYRILFYLPLVASIQMQVFEIDGFRKISLSYFTVMLIIASAEFISVIIDCLRQNLSNDIPIAAVMLKLTVFVLISAIVFGLISQNEKETDNIKQKLNLTKGDKP